MHYGPGVYVGPVFIAMGVLLVALRRSLGAQLARVRPDDELVGSELVAIFGVTTIVGGGLGLLAGLGWLDWWPL